MAMEDAESPQKEVSVVCATRTGQTLLSLWFFVYTHAFICLVQWCLKAGHFHLLLSVISKGNKLTLATVELI